MLAWPEERSGRFLPVEVAAAALADHEAARGLQLLDRLRADPDTAAAADGGGRHGGDGNAAARPEDLLVVDEEGLRELARPRLALTAHAGQLLLDGGELFLDDRLVLPRLSLAPLELHLGVSDVHREALLELHDGEDLLLGLRLLLFDRLDLGEHRGVLGVVLHFPEPRLGTGPLGGDDLQVLLPRA